MDDEFNSAITRILLDYAKHLPKDAPKMDLEGIEESFLKKWESQCKLPSDEFNGFTTEQMIKMHFHPFEEECPVQLRHLTDEELGQIPFMRQVLHLMNALNEKEIKLTARGYLPLKMVETLYKLGTQSKASDSFKLKTEDKIEEVILVHYTLNKTGLIKKRSGKMSLTNKGKKLLQDHNQLLKTVILFLFHDFDMYWLDGLETDLGNIGLLYSLWHLHHYGSQWRDLNLYAEDYFKAFPFLLGKHIYNYRVFMRLFPIIGISQAHEEYRRDELFPYRETRKTSLLEMMFTFEEPALAK